MPAWIALQARCQQSGRCVCIKVYHLSAIGELQRHQALREAHIHMRAYEAALSLVKQGHTLHVVPLYAVFTVGGAVLTCS